jgi:hypothetical protein
MPKLIEKVGFKALELIGEQIGRGIDMDDNQYRYSEKPFAMPAGGKKLPKALEKSGRLRKFVSRRSGKLWQIVTGGYKDWRRINKRSPDGDFLVWSGSLLKSMSCRAQSDTKAVLYFTSAKQAQKAFWLNVSGAGESRKLWKFFGLTTSNQKRLAEYAASLAADDTQLMSDLIQKVIKDLKG